jgi:glycosyltransferase involved in cell wall biosynthesis
VEVVHLYDGHEQVYEGRGSVPGVVWHLAREAAANGHDVTVMERQWAGLDAHATHDGVDFERPDLWTGADEPWTRVPYEQVTSPVGVGQLVTDRTNFAFEALRRLRSRSFDVLHVHLPFAAGVLLTVAPWLRDSTVYTAHLGELRLDALTEDQRGGGGSVEDDADGSGGLEAPAVLSAASPDVYLANRVAHTTVLNETIADAFAERGVDPASLSVLPNGVNLERFANVPERERERVRDAYDLGEGPTLLFVGTVMPRKGVTDLVRAVGELADREGWESVDLLVAGEDDLDGAYVAEVRETAREVEIADSTAFPGFVPEADLAPLYAAADVCVVPSLEEGFGMTAVEALGAGTPVVGTRVGAIPEIIDEGVHGYVVDPGDPAALAGAIDRAVSEPARRTETATAARDRASEYSWKSVGEQCARIYADVSKQRSG